MRIAKRFKTTIALVSVLIACSLLFWLMQSDAAQYAQAIESETRDSVQSLCVLNAQINSEVYSLRQGQSQGFDRLLTLEKALTDRAASMPLADSLQRIVEEKITYCEDFKSTHCVVRNSVANFLGLVEQVRTTSKSKSRRTLDFLAEAEASGMAFIYLSNDENANRFRKSIESLNKSVAANPFSEIQTKVKLIEDHSQIILTDGKSLSDLVAWIPQTSPDSIAAEHENAINERVSQMRQWSAFYCWLGLTSTTILGLYLAWKWWELYQKSRFFALANERLAERLVAATEPKMAQNFDSSAVDSFVLIDGVQTHACYNSRMMKTPQNKPSSLVTRSLFFFLVFLSVGWTSTHAQENQPQATAKPKVKFSDDSFRRAALDGNMQIVKLALESGTDLNAKDGLGHTAMHFAAFNGHTEVVKFLLSKGVEVDVLDGEGKTPLIHASSGPFNETVVFLLDQKAKIDHAEATEGFTALMMAAAEGQLEVVKTLLERGADPTTQDVDGETAEIFASNNGHNEVVELLQNFESNESASPWQANAELVAKLSKNQSEFIYDEAKVPQYVLPDPLVDNAGKRVTTPEQWNQSRRDELMELFRENVYGRRPETEYSIAFEKTGELTDTLDGLATGRSMKAIVKIDQRKFEFPFTVFVPNKVKGKAPAIVLINNQNFISLDDAVAKETEFWPVRQIVESGFATASFFTSDVDPDDKNGYDDGVRAFFADGEPPADDAWRSLSAWGWGASRVLDYLQTIDSVETSRAVIVGHSRGGKTSLWAAAEDPRFAIAYSNNSGCGGAALSRRAFGETVGRITTAFPHWFVPRFGQFAGREGELPIDQHELISLVAPRGVYVTSADEDLWADPKGEYESLRNAAPVFKLLGESSITEPTMPPISEQRVVGKTGYHIRTGGHGLTQSDWTLFLDFAKP